MIVKVGALARHLPAPPWLSPDAGTPRRNPAERRARNGWPPFPRGSHLRLRSSCVIGRRMRIVLINTEEYWSVAPADVGNMVAAHGFALLRSAGNEEGCKAAQERVAQILAQMLAFDGLRVGSRGPGRYSMGAASRSGQQLHHHEWALLMTDSVLDALDSIYGAGKLIGWRARVVREIWA